MHTLDKGKPAFASQGLLCSPLGLGRLPWLPSRALEGASLLLLRTAILWCTLSGFLWRQLHASSTSVVLCWVVRALCFLVGRNCGSRVVELAATPISTTQGAFVRLCIVRCPLPMIISSPSSLRAGGFLLFIGYELLEAGPCHVILLFVFLSSFDCYRFIIMAHSLFARSVVVCTAVRVVLRGVAERRSTAAPGGGRANAE